VRRRRFVLAFALLAPGLAVVPSGSAPADAREPALELVRLRVMTFNVREGAKHVSLEAAAAAIRLADADVVGLQEPFGRTRRLARMLGWYAAPRLHTISRFPIVQVPAGGGRWAHVLVAPGRVVAVANVHNPSWPDGVGMVYGGAPRSAVLEAERGRKVRWTRPFVDALAPLGAAGEPAFFTGDFNMPSWRDWTPRVVRELGWRPRSLRAKAAGPRYPVRWPVSLLLEEAGFRDSYREIHPDVIEEPGYTWLTDLVSYGGSTDLWDRIDFVWVLGPATTVASEIVGPRDRFTDLVSLPWPSDHRAVVSTFEVEPAPAPTFVAPEDVRALIGQDLAVRFHAPAEAGRTVGVWAGGTDVGEDPPLVEGLLPDEDDDGRVVLDTADLPPGRYVVGIRAGAGNVLARMWFGMVDPEATAGVSVSARRVATAEPIEVTFHGAPGNRYDWLSLNLAGADPERDALYGWRYVGGRFGGTVAIRAGSFGNWPLRPGRYQVSLCVDDAYRCVATSRPFRVVAEATS
jgi:endonuclease/exonuclease/phosphatase (EEP) superfamily protein YafD